MNIQSPTTVASRFIHCVEGLSDHVFTQAGSIVSLNVTPLARQLSKVEQTETDESGPSPVELLVPGV